MGAIDLLQHLRTAGFSLDLASDKVVVTPAKALTEEHRQAIRAHKAELIALLAPPLPPSAPAATDPDRWSWPHSDAMTGAEVAAFIARLQHFGRHGLSESDAEALADKLVVRDREHDDRRVCLECTHLGDRGRCLAAAAGRLRGVDRRLEPVLDVLQRCHAFGLRKGLP